MKRYWNPHGWLLPMLGRRRTVTRFGRENLSHAEQRRRIVAARAKRLRRRMRNAELRVR